MHQIGFVKQFNVKPRWRRFSDECIVYKSITKTYKTPLGLL